MPDNHYRKQSKPRDRDPRMGRFILLSSIVHLLVALVFLGVFEGHTPPPKRPVYYVDLSQLPVADPRAGRPDGGKEPAAAVKPSPPPAAVKPTPAPKAPPAPPKPPAPAAIKKPVAPKPATPKPPPPQAAAKPKPDKASKPAVNTSGADYEKAMSAVEKMRRDRERAELKDKIAALAVKDSRGSAANASTAPLGMPDGTGTQDGVSQQLWLEELLRQNWSLSRYQVTRRDLIAEVRITYSADGRLINNRFVKPSGDSTFDDSVTRAILKSPQLEFSPGRQWEVPVTFNLKDLMD